MAVGLPGAHQGGVEVDRFIPIEAEAVALLDGGHIGGHGVHQSADAAHHRDGAVTHREQLADAAGLKARRHQEGITAGIDQPGEIVVVGEEGGKAAAVLARHLPQT